jgi:hypothetical protein
MWNDCLLLTQKLPLVIDADGISIVAAHPEVVKGYTRAVLTPNVPELWRLADALGIQHDRKQPHEDMKTVQVQTRPALRLERRDCVPAEAAFLFCPCSPIQLSMPGIEGVTMALIAMKRMM